MNKCINKQVHHTLCIPASPNYCISVHLNHCISPLPAFNLRRLPESTSIIVDQICLHCSNNWRLPVPNCQLPTEQLPNVTKTGSFLVQLRKIFCNRLQDTCVIWLLDLPQQLLKQLPIAHRAAGQRDKDKFIVGAITKIWNMQKNSRVISLLKLGPETLSWILHNQWKWNSGPLLFYFCVWKFPQNIKYSD